MASRHILITGDFVLDHHIYEGRRHQFGQAMADGVKLVSELGGAALLHQVLTRLLGSEQSARGQEWTSHLVSSPGEVPLVPAFAYWRPYPRQAAREKQFWRVSEAMGFGAVEGGSLQVDRAIDDVPPKAAEIVALSEGSMGFRDTAWRWHEDTLADARWIVLKTTAPVATGPLWDRLAAYRRKLVIVVAATELRQSAARVSGGLSWERTIQDVVRELGPAGAFPSLAPCRGLIVAFGTEGALWFDLADSRDEGALPPDTPVHFLYDASAIEGDHASGVEGGAYGLSSCLAAAVTWYLSRDPEHPDLASAIEAGLAAMRDLGEKGHGPVTELPAGFPAARLAEAIVRPAYRCSRAVFPAAAPAGSSRWSLVGHSQRAEQPVYDLARLVLRRGPIALANLPHLRIGDFLTSDWHEIESLRSLMQIIRQYQLHDAGKKPLSIGVFGPPGAGKSFAVRQLADHLVGASTWLEFNLSQFSTPEDLTGAFHQIRDRVLQGRLPVAFFDEFDSQNYRWLKHLLAPMQDGHFQQGQLTHAVGKCIMVFAGGTSWTFETFGPGEPADRPMLEPAEHRDFRLAKGPDFKSRLDGYLNVVGPNARQVVLSAAAAQTEDADPFGGRWFKTDSSDIHFPLRRALMVRAGLKCLPGDKLDIDEGVAYALLRVSRYTHGARSLGKVIQPLAVVRPGPLRRSLLLPAAQLDMHVPAQEFLDLCDQAPASPYPPGDPLTEREIAVMAPAIHETYRALGKKAGWLKPELDKSFEQLADFFKESNRAAAGRMLEILGLIGLQLEDGAATTAEEDALRAQLEYALETLAEAEHEGWMAWHFAQGWRYGSRRDDERRVHPCLRPYAQLTKAEIDKDRETIRRYPEFAREAGKAIRKASTADRGRPLASPAPR